MEKLFAISYKLRYAETSDWGEKYIKAPDKKHALNKFTKLKKIRTSNYKSVNEWQWEEGVWMATFWNIKQISEISCPFCSGKETIHS